jgi:hypothetical protein
MAKLGLDLRKEHTLKGFEDREVENILIQERK